MTQNLTYLRSGDYLIPDIRLTDTEPLIRNRFVRMAELNLKENNPILYNDMILNEKLIPYLREIGETAARRMEQLMTELLEKNPAPDKSTQQLAWVRHMSMLREQAEELTIAELIYN